MKRIFPHILILTLAFATSRAGAADSTNVAAAKPAPVKADTKVDFQSFHLLMERNIFDPSRSGRSRIRSAPVRQVKVDDFALLGTMSYEKGTYAFFDGNSSEYRKNCKVGETIADYKITAIESGFVKLQSTNNQTITMPVGGEMSRRDRGPWSLGTRTDVTVTATESSDTSTPGSKSSGSPTNAGAAPAAEQKPDSAGGSSADDVIKRLMEKRAKLVQDGQ